MFNDRLAKVIVRNPNNINGNRQIDDIDREAERQGTAIRFSSRPMFKGRRLLNRAPNRQSLAA